MVPDGIVIALVACPFTIVNVCPLKDPGFIMIGAGGVPYNCGSPVSLITTPTPATLEEKPAHVLRILTTGALTTNESLGTIVLAVSVNV